MVSIKSDWLTRLRNWLEIYVLERWLFRRAIERVYLIVGGHIYFQTLSAAIELDVFTLLEKQGPMTREQIATALHCELQPTRILLLGCSTLQLLRKRGPYYSNTPMAKRLFVKGSKKGLRDVVRWQHFINYKAMSHFAEAIKANKNVGLNEFRGTETTLYERLAHDKPLEQIFQDAMENISVQANSALAEHLDFSKTQMLLDVGGGNATNIISLARKFPKLRANVFDSQSVCEIAKARIREEGLSDRLGATAGNCFNDPFPDGVDAILFCHFFTIWSAEQNKSLLRKCHQSLAPGGSAIIFNMMQHDSEDGPLSAAMGSPYFLTLATGVGMLYTWREYVEWFRAAGFSRVDKYRLPRDHGLIIGRK